MRAIVVGALLVALSISPANAEQASVEDLKTQSVIGTIDLRGHLSSRVDDCSAYYGAVQTADGSVRVVRAQPSGGRCSFKAIVPKAPTDVLVMVGFGGPKTGWLVTKKYVRSLETYDFLMVPFTIQEADVQRTIKAFAPQRDWSAHVAYPAPE